MGLLIRETTEFWQVTQAGAVVRLHWTTASERMVEDDFRHALDRLSVHAEETGVTAIRIDVHDLRYRPTRDDMAWRDSNITPRWNRAGIRKLAYIVSGIAPGGGIPAHRPGEDFLTRFCDDENAADAWLAEA